MVSKIEGCILPGFEVLRKLRITFSDDNHAQNDGPFPDGVAGHVGRSGCACEPEPPMARRQKRPRRARRRFIFIGIPSCSWPPDSPILVVDPGANCIFYLTSVGGLCRPPGNEFLPAGSGHAPPVYHNGSDQETYGMNEFPPSQPRSGLAA